MQVKTSQAGGSYAADGVLEIFLISDPRKVSLRSRQGALPMHPIGKPAWFSNPFHDFLFEFADRAPLRTAVPFRMVGGLSGSHPPRVRTSSVELNLMS
jgi:hypothetical protein